MVAVHQSINLQYTLELIGNVFYTYAAGSWYHGSWCFTCIDVMHNMYYFFCLLVFNVVYSFTSFFRRLIEAFIWTGFCFIRDVQSPKCVNNNNYI